MRRSESDTPPVPILHVGIAVWVPVLTNAKEELFLPQNVEVPPPWAALSKQVFINKPPPVYSKGVLKVNVTQLLVSYCPDVRKYGSSALWSLQVQLGFKKT